MVRNEGFEPPIADSESVALPLGELRRDIVFVILLILYYNQNNIFKISYGK